MCFGISKYGNNSYKMEYDITNFVSKLNDSDIIYWTLINSNMNPSPKNVSIKIYSDFKYSDSIPIWGYGNYGDYAYVSDGYIQLQTKDSLKDDEYMAILARFPKGTFNSSNVIDKEFNYYFAMAENGVTHYNNRSKNRSPLLTGIIFFGALILLILFEILLKKINILINSAFTINNTKNRLSSGNVNLGKKKLPYRVNYSRDIPKISVYDAYFISCQYKLLKNDTDFFGVLLLKWLLEQKIVLKNIEEKKLFKTVKTKVIQFKEDDVHFENDYEADLWRMMCSQADSNGFLKENSFIAYCKLFYERIFEWFQNLLISRRDLLINSGKGTAESVTKKFFFSYNYTVYNFDDSLYDDALKLKGLKKFLNDFSVVSKREPIEVNLWKEYLIYAQLFGIADKVAKAFEKLYPSVLSNGLENYSYTDFEFFSRISRRSIRGAYSGKSRHDYKASSYSSGGGGFSSGGGGRGSFGGSSGGSSGGGIR